MTVHIPGNLLVPYILSAAEEVLREGTISERSTWALRDARRQLAETLISLSESGAASDPGRSARLAAAAHETTPQFATLAVSALVDEGLASPVGERNATLEAVLSGLKNDIDGVLRAEVEAAERVVEKFATTVTRLAAGQLQSIT